MRLVLALFLAFYSLIAHADEAEMQEVRLAKAQIALAEGNDKEAMAFIAGNLNPQHFHRASYQFLVDYHLKKGNVSKAFKVLYYMIGKLHDRRVLNARFDDNFTAFIASLGPPPREALEVYFAIAELYYQFYLKKIFSPKFNQRLLRLSEKYFTVTSFYRHELALTKVYLGKIHNERANFQGALEQFIEAKELFREEFEIEGEEGLEDMNFLIGSTLVQGGLIDPGSLYLRSVYTNSESNSAIKAIAQEYLNILTYRFFSLTAKYELGFNSNVYELNDVQLSNYSLAESVLGPEDGSFSRISASLFYNYPKITENIGTFLLASFAQESYSNELHKNRNERTITFGTELKYEGLEKGVPKLRYYLTQNYAPDGNVDEFDKISATSFIELLYVRPIKAGTLTYSLPILMTSYETEVEENSIGFSLSYAPFWINRRFAPSLSVGYFQREEVGIEDKSSRFEVAGTVQSEWSDKLSTFANLVVRKNSNNIDRFDYNEIESSLNATWLWRYGLSFGLDASWRRQDLSTDRTIEIWTISSGLSFTY